MRDRYVYMMILLSVGTEVRSCSEYSVTLWAWNCNVFYVGLNMTSHILAKLSSNITSKNFLLLYHTKL